jgi:hypothetical protein
MKTENKIKRIVYGGYALLFLFSFVVSHYLLQKPVSLSLLISAGVTLAYPALCIGECWIQNSIREKKNNSEKDEKL